MVIIDTKPYEQVHGVSPKGHRLWAFEAAGTVYQMGGAYTAALRSVKFRAGKLGLDTLTIRVLP